MVPLVSLLLVFVGVTLASIAQVRTGRGLRLVAAPILMFALGHAEGVRLTCALGLILSIAMFWAEKRPLERAEWKELVAPAALTAPIWVYVIGFVPGPTAARLAGVAILLAVSLVVADGSLRHLFGQYAPSAAGVASSAMFAVGGVGGAPLAFHGGDADQEPGSAGSALHACAAVTQAMVLIFLGFPNLFQPALAVALIAMAFGMLRGWLKPGKTKLHVISILTIVGSGLGALALVIFGTLS